MKKLNIFTIALLVILMNSCSPVWALSTSDILTIFLIGIVFIVIIGYFIKVAIENIINWIKNIFNGYER